MSFASSASSSLGAATRSVFRPAAARANVRSAFAATAFAQAESSTQARNYASAAALADEPSTSYSSPPPSGSPRRSQASSSGSASSSSSSSSSLPPASTSIPVLTPEGAQSYLSDLLHLSPAQAFPPPLAMQTLTHKSYKYAHLVKPSGSSFRSRLLGQDHPGSAAASGAHSVGSGADAAAQAEFLEASMQPHNARLSFIGRRALTTYFALFVHDAVRTSRALRETALLELKDGLDHKISAMRDSRNLGRTVGDRWGVGDVMRWDRNQNSLPSSAAKIKGLTVEAIFGALYSLHGGPAAQRAFHLHILPLLSWQLRDPALQDRAESLRKDVHSQFGGGVLIP